ncbi:MAG: alpha/beta hydrolase [Pseudomonadales bacterium]|nr:alpha/beta hydrolase [Pseudomonadales bacterium]
MIQSHRVEIEDKVTLNYLSEGEGEISVLLFNGAGSPLTTWNAVAERLVPRYRVIRFDQRNAGDTAAEGTFTLLDTARDAAALLQSLRISEVIAVGHAWGGRAAQVFARDYPHLVSKLVVCGTGGQLPANDPQQLMKKMAGARKSGDRSAWEDAVAGMFCAPGFPESEPETFRQICDAIWSRTQTANARWDPAVAPSASYWGMARQRTLLIYGTEDRQGTPENARDLASRLEHAKLEFVANAGHFVIGEQPAQVAKLISDFIGSP